MADIQVTKPEVVESSPNEAFKVDAVITGGTDNPSVEISSELYPEEEGESSIVFRRYAALGNLTWTTAHNWNSQLGYYWPSMAITPERKRHLAPFSLYRFRHVRFRITLPTIEFGQGVLKINYVPGGGSSHFYSMNGSYLYVSQGGTIEMDIPYVYSEQMLDSNNIGKEVPPGTLFITVVSPLKLPSTMTEVNLLVESKFDGWYANIPINQGKIENLAEAQYYLYSNAHNEPSGREILSSAFDPMRLEHHMKGLHCSVEYLIDHEGHAGTVEINKDFEVGKLIRSIDVSAMVMGGRKDPITNTGTMGGMLDVLTSLCSEWGGNVEYTLRISKSASTNCTLAFVYVPPEVEMKEKFDDMKGALVAKVILNNANEIILDLGCLAESWLRKVHTIDKRRHEACNGRLGMYLLSKVTYSVVNDKPIHITYWKRASRSGRDPIGLFWPCNQPRLTGHVEIKDNGITMTGNPKSASARALVAGGEFHDVRQLLMKSNVTRLVFNGDKNRAVYPIPVDPTFGAMGRGNVMRWLSQFYEYWNGSLEYMIQTDVNVQEIRITRANLGISDYAHTTFSRFGGAIEPMMNLRNLETTVEFCVQDRPKSFVQRVNHSSDLIHTTPGSNYNQYVELNCYNAADETAAKKFLIYHKAGVDFVFSGYRGMDYMDYPLIRLLDEIDEKPFPTYPRAPKKEEAKIPGFERLTLATEMPTTSQSIVESTTPNAETRALEVIPIPQMANLTDFQTFWNNLTNRRKNIVCQWIFNNSPEGFLRTYAASKQGGENFTTFTWRTQYSKLQPWMGHSIHETNEQRAREGEVRLESLMHRSVFRARDNFYENIRASAQREAEERNTFTRATATTIRNTERVGEAAERIADTVEGVRDNFEEITPEITETLRSIRQTTTCVNDLTRTIEDRGLMTLLFGDGENFDKGVSFMTEIVQLYNYPDLSHARYAIIRICALLGIASKVKDFLLKLWSSPREQGEEVVNQADGDNTTSNLLAAVVMALGFKVSGGDDFSQEKAASAWKKATQRCRDISALRKGKEDLKGLFAEIKEGVAEVAESLGVPGLSYTPEAAALKTEMITFFEKMKVLIPSLSQKKAFAMNSENRKKVRDLYPEYMDLNSRVLRSADRDLLPRWHKIELAYVELTKAISETTTEFPYKRDPFTVMITGDPGVGKSEFSSYVIQLLNASQGDDIDDIWTYNTASDYHVGYMGQAGVLCDDADQGENPRFSQDFVSWNSNTAAGMNHPAVEQKGIMFVSKVLVGTSNFEYPDGKDIKLKEAYNRRRNCLARVKKVSEFTRDFTHLKIATLPVTQGQLTGEPNFLPAAEFVTKLIIEYSEHLRTQETLFNLNYPSYKPRVYVHTQETARKVLAAFNAKRFVDPEVGLGNVDDLPILQGAVDDLRALSAIRAGAYEGTDELLVRWKDAVDIDADGPEKRLLDIILWADTDMPVNEAMLDGIDGVPEGLKDVRVAMLLRQRRLTSHRRQFVEWSDAILRAEGFNVDAINTGAVEYFGMDDEADAPNIARPGWRNLTRDGDYNFLNTSSQVSLSAFEYFTISKQRGVITLRGFTGEGWVELNNPDDEMFKIIVRLLFVTAYRYRQEYPDLVERLKRLYHPGGNNPFLNIWRKLKGMITSRFDDHDRLMVLGPAMLYGATTAGREALEMWRYFGFNPRYMEQDVQFREAYWGYVETRYIWFSNWVTRMEGRLIRMSGIAPVLMMIARTMSFLVVLPCFGIGALFSLTTEFITGGIFMLIERIRGAFAHNPWLWNCISLMTFGFLALTIGNKIWKKIGDKHSGMNVIKRYKKMVLESSDAIAIKVQDHYHHDLPNDGKVHSHIHICDKCGKAYSHAHAKKPYAISVTFGNKCLTCRKKDANYEDEELYSKISTEAYDASKSTGKGKKRRIILESKDKAKIFPYTKKDEEIVEFAAKLEAKEPSKLAKIEIEAEIKEDESTSIFKRKSKKRNKKEAKEENESKKQDSDWSSSTDSSEEEDDQIEVTNEASSCPPADDFFKHKVVPNSGWIKIRGRTLNFIGIGGNIILTSAHVFDSVPNTKSGVESAIFWKKGVPGVQTVALDLAKDVYFWQNRTEFTTTNGIFGKTKAMTETVNDRVLIRLKCKHLPAMQNITSSFISQAQLDRICGFSVKVIDHQGTPSEPEDHEIKVYERAELNQSLRIPDFVKTYYSGSTATYNGDTRQGMCGAAVVTRNPSVTGGRIIGIHSFGYTQYDQGGCHIITREELIGAYNEFTGLHNQCYAPPISYIVDELEVVEIDPDQPVPTGDMYHIIGAIKEPYFEPNNSQIRPTAIFDQFQKHVTQPAILSRNDARNPERISPHLKAVNKFESAGGWNEKFMTRSKNYLVKKAVKLAKRTQGPQRVLTIEEAVNGIPGILEPLNMQTACGIPYDRHPERPIGATGKYWLFDSEYLPDGVIHRPKEWFRQDIEKALRILREEGWAWRCFYKDNLKDERRKIKKILSVDTRMFNICNVLWLIIMKMFYGSVQIFLQQTKENFHNAVGFNMFGDDVTRLVNKLRRHPKFFAADVSKYDGRFDQATLRTSIAFCKKWLGRVMLRQGYPEDDIRTVVNMCERVGVCMVSVRIHVFGSVVYMVFIGMPSGIYCTIVFNTLGWMMRCFTAAQEIIEKNNLDLTLEEFDELTTNIFLGDDSVNSVEPELGKYWNAVSLAEVHAQCNIEMTPPTKGGEEFVEFEEFEDITFLKCSYREDGRYPGKWHACIDKENPIGELSNWIRNTIPESDATVSNANDMLRFSYGWGKKKFSETKKRIDRLLARHGFDLTDVEFEECDALWKKDHGIEL